MNNTIMDHDGPVFSVLDKVGQMIVLSLLWIAGCLPVVTALTSTTALYYAVIKSIRHENGSAFKEFWRSYRSNLLRGIPATVLFLVVCYLLTVNIKYLSEECAQTQNFLLWGSVMLGVVVAAIAVYICPVLSRFSMSLFSAVKLAFVMAIRYLPVTLLLSGGTLLLIYLQFFVLPIPAVLILPALWTFLVTFPMEKCLRKFMPTKEDNDESWYYQ